MNQPRLLLAILLLAAVAATTRPAASQAVAMKNRAFVPAALSIHVGDTIIWTNQDDHDHTVVSDDGSFKSDNISTGSTFEHQFTKTGTFSYGCTYHPRMKGTITVSN